MTTQFALADIYTPFELLRLSKDAFYEIIEEQMSNNNDGVNIEVTEAELEFEVKTVEYVDYVYIKATVIDYKVKG